MGTSNGSNIIDESGTSGIYGHARAMDIEGSAIYVAGYSNADSVNQVVKYDLDGNLQATINLTQPTHSDFTSSHKPYVNDLDATSNGVYVTMTRQEQTHSGRSKLTKLDNNLSSEVWQVDPSGNYGLYTVKVMPNGNIIANWTPQVIVIHKPDL